MATRPVDETARRWRTVLPTLAAAVLAVLLLGACTLPPPPGNGPLRYRDTVFSSVDVSSGIPYGSAPDANGNPVTLTLDLYQPHGDAQTGRPAVVWVHGGGFCCGSSTNTDVAALSRYFAQLGYVAVSINYRLLSPTGCGGGGTPSATCVNAAIAAQHDAQAAVRWLRVNASTYDIDPNRIAIGGTSAGAVTAIEVGERSDDPGDSGNPGPSSAVGAFVSISGGFPSPFDSAFANSGDAGGLFFHGTADTTVPYSWAVSTAAALYNVHVPVVFEALQGAGHVPWAQYSTLFEQQSDYWMYYMLDLAHAAGQPSPAATAFDRDLGRYLRRNPTWRHLADRLRHRYERARQ
jgi:dienelactone hydrolase